MLPYQNPKLDIEQRLDDLISRMTLEELILQTDQYASTSVDPSPRGDATRVIPLEKMEEVFRGMSAGSVGAGIQLRPRRTRSSATRWSIPAWVSL